MKIVVCIRQGLDGEISPFDASAYEAALRIDGAEITLLSMASERSRDFLSSLTRLGASRAVLLSDKAFAGADTLATAYALQGAIEKLSPDYIFCGRQTLIGDTAQTPPMLSELAGYSLITNVMKINSITDEEIVCETRSDGEVASKGKTLVTLERINTLRLPRLRSKIKECEVWSAEDIGVDTQKCGLVGSPTRVIETFENKSGRRHCKFIKREELDAVIAEALSKKNAVTEDIENSSRNLKNVLCIGKTPLTFAKTVSDDVSVIPLTTECDIAKKISELEPSAVIFGSDARSKRVSAILAARLGLGLCADCTRLECEGEELIMYRPALSGSIIAKIRSTTRPAMATVRTESEGVGDIVVGAGFGVKDKLSEVRVFAERLGASLVSSRKLVDNDYMPYVSQVGLTGMTQSPPVYIAIGISGAVHHIVGIERSGTVIAINPDKNAPIFEYADYGIIDEF